MKKTTTIQNNVSKTSSSSSVVTWLSCRSVSTEDDDLKFSQVLLIAVNI